MKNTIFIALLMLAVAAGAPAQETAVPAPAPTADFSPANQAELKKLGFVLARGKVTAPDFALKDLQGRTRSLSSFRGKVVFLNFWGVWCYYCRLEMPSLQRLYDRFKTKGFEIVAINVQDTEQTARDYIEKNKHTFPVLLDTDLKAVGLYGPRGFPTSYLIDRDGTLRAMLVGTREWDTADVYRTFEKVLAPQ